MEKLTDICEIQYGYAFDSTCFTEDNSYPPLVRIRDVKRGYSETFYLGRYPEKYVVHNGDLLVGMDGEFNIARWKSADALLNQRVCKLTAKEGNNEEYLRFAMVTALKNIEDKTAFVTVKHLSAKDLNKLELEMPLLEEQNLRAERLLKLEKIIELRKKEIKWLEDLVKSRFVEMFGNPIINTKGWPKKRFDEICENLDSRRKPITASEREAGRYPYYGASGVVDYVANYIFDEDLLLVSEDGANLLMRSTPIAFSVSGKVWVNNHAHVVRFKEMSMQKYIEIYFSMIDISDQITGSAQPKLNQAKLNAIRFAIPNEALLDEYYDFIKKVDKSKLLEWINLAKKSFDLLHERICIW